MIEGCETAQTQEDSMEAAPWSRPAAADMWEPCSLTRLHRMGRKMVMVAGLLTNSVTMDTRMQASRVMAHGGRLLRDNIWCPIHVERPELCRPRDAVRRRKSTFPVELLDSRRSGMVGAGGTTGDT